MKKFYNIIINIVIIIVFLFGGIVSSQDVIINFTGGCLTGVGEDCLIINPTEGEEKTVLTVTQDIVLAATYGVGTVLTIVVIYCGLMYIFASRNGKDPNKYKTGLIYAGIGAILVWFAYPIVRLIQYIVRG